MSFACQNCGYSMPDDSMFCPKCGSKQSLICRKCGKELIKGAAFCAHCGTPINSPDMQELSDLQIEKAGDVSAHSEAKSRAADVPPAIDNSEAGLSDSSVKQMQAPQTKETPSDKQIDKVSDTQVKNEPDVPSDSVPDKQYTWRYYKSSMVFTRYPIDITAAMGSDRLDITAIRTKLVRRESEQSIAYENIGKI